MDIIEEINVRKAYSSKRLTKVPTIKNHNVVY